MTRSLRSLLSVVTLSFASTLTAQGLILQQSETGDPGTWSSTPPSGSASSIISLRLTGIPGEWVRIATDMDADPTSNDPQVPTWLQPVPQVQMTSLISSAEGTPDDPNIFIDVHPGRFLYNYWVGIYRYDALGSIKHSWSVQDFYVPLPPTSGARVWDSDPPMWSSGATGNGFAPVSKAWWDSLAASHWFPDENLPSTSFSLDGLARASIWWRAQLNAVPESEWNAYFDSEHYAAAMQSGLYRLCVMAQGMRPQVPQPSIYDHMAKPLAWDPEFVVPKVRIVPGLRWPLVLPDPMDPYRWNATNVKGLNTGTLVADQEVKFEAEGLISPVEIGFPTTTGVTWVLAHSMVERLKWFQYGVTTPRNLIPGAVILRNGWSTSVTYLVGQITMVQR
ncbi:MAG: hypothetical protein KDC95_19075 [Planctomycetes bacterium]|nr:hypothetical protein [Planctomycetota bacterium]